MAKEALNMLISIEAKARLMAEAERRRKRGQRERSQAAIVNELLLTLPSTPEEAEHAIHPRD